MLNKPQNIRDLTVIELTDEEVLVIACDSLGGIGSKENDSIKAPAQLLGMFTTRVPLMEVISAGAKPAAVINTLCVEMNPTGLEIIKGIKNELASSGLTQDIMINGSTEENVPTSQSGLGVTVVGRAQKSELRLGTSKKGSLIVCLGEPKVGKEVLDDSLKADTLLVKKLISMPIIKEVLPVGSKGVRYEAQQLAKSSNCKLDLFSQMEIDIDKSAGPATCVLATIAEKDLNNLRDNINLSMHKIGQLI